MTQTAPPDWMGYEEQFEAPAAPAARPLVPYMRLSEHVDLAIAEQERALAAEPRRLRWGLPRLDELMTGMKTGTLTTAVARSSGGKSSAIYNLAHMAARGIAERAKLDREVVVVLSGEDLFGDIARFTSARPSNPSAPLIALDKYRRTTDGRIEVGRKPLTLNEMLRHVEGICEERDLVPVALCMDYAGAIQVDSTAGVAQEGNRIALFDATCELLISAARAWDCPAVLGAQANRTAHGGVPRADSVFGGDNLFHHSNCMFSLFSCGEDPDAKGDDYKVMVKPGKYITRIQDSVWLQVLKNRGGKRDGMLLHRDPATRFFTYEYRPDEYKL